MKAILKDRLTVVWLVLSAITLVSWQLGHSAHSDGHLIAREPVTVAVLAIGFIKTRLVLRHFMEVSTGPRWLRTFSDVWLIGFWTAFLVIHLWR